jgi:HlyD family secretion protein
VGTWIATILVALLGLALLWWRGVVLGASSEAIDPDRVVVVEARDVIDSVNATGRIEPLARVAVMSRASGIIEELLADEGDVVATGQVLAELDREQLAAQLQQDEADLLAAEARLAAAKARLEEARVRVTDPEVDFLRREAARFEELVASGNAALQDRDDAARALANAEFRVQLVKANLPVLEAAVTESEAQLAATRAARDRSVEALLETTITSPIDGVVLTRDKEVGDGVSSILTAGGNATQIMTLGDLSEMHVEARVDEVDLGRIHVDMPALVTVDAHRGTTLEGRVEKVAPAGSIDDNGIVTFEVEVSVADPDRLLKPDMTADARLVIDRRDGVASLPQAAVQRSADGSWFVERIVPGSDGDVIERVTVELGLSDGLVTEVTSGLTPGERVLLPPTRGGR